MYRIPKCTATILIYPRPQAKALVRFATESAWAGTARKTVALLYLSRDIISALGLWYKRIPKSSYMVVRELQLCSPSPVPRPTLAPSQNGLAHEVEFLGFMGGATSLLIDHSRCELLYKGLLRGCLYSVDWNGPLDYWNGPLDYWNGLLDHWNGLLEHACHKFEVSRTIVHMHACMHTAKNERLLQQWISCWSCIIIILCYTTVFVREQCSDTLHGYHSIDSYSS